MNGLKLDCGSSYSSALYFIAQFYMQDEVNFLDEEEER